MPDEDITYAPEKLHANLTVTTPEQDQDHVRITLEWEKSAKSAVVALGKLGNDQNKILALFSAAVQIDGDYGPEDESK